MIRGLDYIARESKRAFTQRWASLAHLMRSFANHHPLCSGAADKASFVMVLPTYNATTGSTAGWWQISPHELETWDHHVLAKGVSGRRQTSAVREQAICGGKFASHPLIVFCGGRIMYEPSEKSSAKFDTASWLLFMLCEPRAAPTSQWQSRPPPLEPSACCTVSAAQCQPACKSISCRP
jgi:hypothetical protein